MSRTHETLNSLFNDVAYAIGEKTGETVNASAYQLATTGSKAKINSIGGKTVVFNQLAQNGNFADGVTYWGGVYGEISVANNELTYTSQVEHGFARIQQSLPEIHIGHKYLGTCMVNPQDATMFRVGISTQYSDMISIQPNVWASVGLFVTPTDTTEMFFSLHPNVSSALQIGHTVKFKNVMLFDLTQMFGAGNEPTTVEEFKAMFPLDYYAYNSGELVSADVKSIDSGNLFDVNSVESGKFQGTGSGAVIDFSSAGCVEVLKLVKGETYIVSRRNISDFNRFQIGYTTETPSRVEPFTEIKEIESHNNELSFTYRVPRDAEYVVLYMSSGEAVIKEEFDVSIKRKDGALPIPQAIRNLPLYGVSAGSVYNEVDYENMEYIQRVGSRAYQSGDENNPLFTTDGAITYYPLSTSTETDISDIITGSLLLNTEAGGTVTFSQSDYQLPVPVKLWQNGGTVDLNEYVADNFPTLIRNIPDEPYPQGGKNVQIAPHSHRVTSATMTECASITVEKTGTYKVSWMAAAQAAGSATYNYSTRAYVDGTAIGSTHYTNAVSETGTDAFIVTENNVSLTAGQVIEVRAMSRGTSYYTIAGMLVIEEVTQTLMAMRPLANMIDAEYQNILNEIGE